MSDWIYYLSAIVLLIANLIAWAGIFYRLAGHWIIFANCLLFMSLLPARPSGLGLGWFAICLIGLLAVLGDSFNFAIRRHSLFRATKDMTSRSRILVGAGLGSLTCVIAGMAVPIVGSMLAVLGAVAGAAGGAWLGSVITPKAPLRESAEPIESRLLTRFLTEEQIKILPRVVCGGLMLLIAFSSTFV
ncbi:hypothetical protein AB1L42_07725 [Thalassoglobus sp. JC818]|uniref:hypothetical protein n=1 Tax=Thalassoglobus sp. JC818 TaxID=3232136 RepID=UPI00345951A1